MSSLSYDAARGPRHEDVGRIHPATTLGHVHLTVADLEKQVQFYQGVLGLKVHRREGDTAYLGAGKEDLLLLTERRDARQVRRTTGLYHLCILVPARVELAQLLRSIEKSGAPVQGLVDHHTAEAIYLDDAEGNGIELDSDRPREQWPSMAQLPRMGNAPLDVEGLMAELNAAPGAWEGLHPETRIGHVHLHVANLVQARDFYHGVLGFDEMMQFAGQAGFVSAGGYHHHVAYNIWAGVGAPPPPADATGLRHFAVQLPSAEEREKVLGRVAAAGIPVEESGEGALVRDPSRNGVLLTVAPLARA